MSYLKLRRTQEIGVEVNAECQACGSGLLSEADERRFGADFVQGTKIVVKVPPFCSHCLRERDERVKVGETNRANNREG